MKHETANEPHEYLWRIVLFLIMFVLINSPLLAIADDSLRETNRSVSEIQMHSVLKIETYKLLRKSVGTAVLIELEDDTLWLITAYHVIWRQSNVVVKGNNTEADFYSLGSLCVVPRLGIAAVKIDDDRINIFNSNNLDAFPASLSSERIPATDVSSYGHPRLLNTAYWEKFYTSGSIGGYKLAQAVLVNYPDVINRVAYRTTLMVINDFTISPGYSGGPVFGKTDSTTVLGIIQGGIGRENVVWAIPASDIKTALEHEEEFCESESNRRSVPEIWPQRGFNDAVYSGLEETGNIETNGMAKKAMLLSTTAEIPIPLHEGSPFFTGVSLSPLFAFFFSDNKSLGFYTGFGIGMVNIISMQQSFGPFKDTVIESSGYSSHWGGRLHLPILSVRTGGLKKFGFHFLFKPFGEYFPKIEGRVKDKMHFGITIQLGPTLKINKHLFSLFSTFTVRRMPKLDRYYESPTKYKSFNRESRFLLGGGLQYGQNI